MAWVSGAVHIGLQPLALSFSSWSRLGKALHGQPLWIGRSADTLRRHVPFSRHL